MSWCILYNVCLVYSDSTKFVHYFKCHKTYFCYGPVYQLGFHIFFTLAYTLFLLLGCFWFRFHRNCVLIMKPVFLWYLNYLLKNLSWKKWSYKIQLSYLHQMSKRLWDELNAQSSKMLVALPGWWRACTQSSICG